MLGLLGCLGLLDRISWISMDVRSWMFDNLWRPVATESCPSPRPPSNLRIFEYSKPRPSRPMEFGISISK